MSRQRRQRGSWYTVHGNADMPARRNRAVPSRHAFLPVTAVLVLLCIIAAGCLSQVIFPVVTGNQTHRAENEGRLFVFFFDVGQGDATLFVADGKTILVDAGETEAGDRLVRDLKALNITKIDLLVSTHPHSDHIGGMQKVLAAFPVGQVLDSGVPHPSPLYERFLETIEEKNIPYRTAEQGQTVAVDPAFRVLVLSPPEQRYGNDPNSNSVVLRISYGMIDFLMTGDVGGAAEEALLKSGHPLDAEVLKVSHHGSSSATSPAFLARVRPELAVISLGADNPYGHPHKETCNRLAGYGTMVYRTDRDGTVAVRTDGISYSVKTGTHDSGVLMVPPAPATDRSLPVISIPALTVFDRLPAFSLPAPPADFSALIPEIIFPQIGNSSGISLSATQFNAPGDDRLNLNGEWVQLTNRGKDTVLIAGWTLSDSRHVTLYTFPAIVLLPGETVTIFTGAGTPDSTALFMGKKEPVWGNEGDIAILKDGRGSIIDQKSEGYQR